MNALSPIQVENIDTTTARLPAAYEAAKNALANCISLDECQSWANKAQALASYARQADDDALEKQAIRIKSRAIRRCGELLQEFASAGGRPKQGDDGEETYKVNLTSSPKSQRQAADQAGMSLHQERTAIRVANVPQDLFDAEIESEAPPTITTLAEVGKKDAAVSHRASPRRSQGRFTAVA